MKKSFISLIILCSRAFLLFGIIILMKLLCIQPTEKDIQNSIEDCESAKNESEQGAAISLDHAEEDGEKEKLLKQLIVGEDYFLVLYDDGSVWSWGNNAEGKLGIAESFVSEPQRIEVLENVAKLEDGGCNIFALTEQGDVYSWGKKQNVIFMKRVDSSALIYKPYKLKDLREILDITVQNGKLYALNGEGNLYASENPWVYGYFIAFSQVQNSELFGEIDSMFSGAGYYDYFIRTDGTVFSFMTYMYEGDPNTPYAFIFPHVGDITPAEEEILDIFLYPPLPEGLPEITVLDGYHRGGYLIYYNLAGVDDIDTVSSDLYTVFLSKEDGTFCYWNSDRIKYHDFERALVKPDTQRERCDGNFEEIFIADVLEMDSNTSEIPHVISIKSGTENTMFLTDDGQVFISRYECYEVADVDFGYFQYAHTGQLNVNTRSDMPLKELKFQKLELTDIESIWTNGENCFCAVDREGGYYRIVINDNEVSQVYQGLIP